MAFKAKAIVAGAEQCGGFRRATKLSVKCLTIACVARKILPDISFDVAERLSIVDLRMANMGVEVTNAVGICAEMPDCRKDRK